MPNSFRNSRSHYDILFIGCINLYSSSLFYDFKEFQSFVLVTEIGVLLVFFGELLHEVGALLDLEPTGTTNITRNNIPIVFIQQPFCLANQEMCLGFQELAACYRQGLLEVDDHFLGRYLLDELQLDVLK